MRHAGSLAVLKPSPERLSVLVGLLGIMLAAVPGYALLGDRERLLMIAIAFAIVAVFTAIVARRLGKGAWQDVVRLCLQLGALWILGCMVMGGWRLLVEPDTGHVLPLWAEALPAGMTLGLMIHVLISWWQQDRRGR